MRSIGASSSSATIWRSAVDTPVPSSTFPQNTVIDPSAAIDEPGVELIRGKRHAGSGKRSGADKPVRAEREADSQNAGSLQEIAA